MQNICFCDYKIIPLVLIVFVASLGSILGFETQKTAGFDWNDPSAGVFLEYLNTPINLPNK